MRKMHNVHARQQSRRRKKVDRKHTCGAFPNKELYVVAYAEVDNAAIGDELVPNNIERDVAPSNDEGGSDHRRDSLDIRDTPVDSVSLLVGGCSASFVGSSSAKILGDWLGSTEILSTAVFTILISSAPRRFNTGGTAPTPPPGRVK